jgi:dipeptidyl aminopeptidase/acylaminoacyl peptidase
MEQRNGEDELFQEYASQEISPDGKWLVWFKSTAEKQKDARVSNLFLSTFTEDQEMEPTRGSDRYRSPRYSPHGERIALISSREPSWGQAFSPEHRRKPVPLWRLRPRVAGARLRE